MYLYSVRPDLNRLRQRSYIRLRAALKPIDLIYCNITDSYQAVIYEMVDVLTVLFTLHLVSDLAVLFWEFSLETRATVISIFHFHSALILYYISILPVLANIMSLTVCCHSQV